MASSKHFDNLPELEQDILVLGSEEVPFDLIIARLGFSREVVIGNLDNLARKLGVAPADPDATLSRIVAAARKKNWIK